MTKILKLPELLAPAGTLEIAVAAFDAGADAVYCGLTDFNARARAGNFSETDLGRLIDYAHTQERKVFVVFNTLLREDELLEAAKALSRLAVLQPDALIVQDFGVVHLIKKYFPELRFHASTQMGIHNLSGVRMAAELGFTRVILERQLSLEEVGRIAKHSPIELETFIHGSLCCSLSGRCLLSSFAGGMSGNRGKCKQPCRRSYAALDNSNSRGCFLSPRDLNGSGLLEKLAGFGIASLKIEGRLRGPEYVWKTVHGYRLLLDNLREFIPERQDEAETLLNSTSTRQGSAGFYDGGKNLLRPEAPGAFGTEAAKVIRTSKEGMWLAVSGRLHLGDRLRLVPASGGEGESFSLINMLYKGKAVLKALPGTQVLLPGNFTAKKDWKVYKIGENGFDFTRRAAALPAQRTKLHLSIHCTAKEWSGTIVELPGVNWRRETDFAAAEKRPFTVEQATELFSGGVPEGFQALPEIKIDGRFFLPLSTAKELRREFWQFFLPLLNKIDPAADAECRRKNFESDYRVQNGSQAINTPELQNLVPSFVSPLEEQIPPAAEKTDGIAAIPGLHALWYLKNTPGKKYAVFPLPVSNSQAARFFYEQGIGAAEAEPELDDAAFQQLLDKSPIPLWRSGKLPPLLVSRLKWKKDFRIKDDAGEEFIICYDNKEKLSKLYSCNSDAQERFRKTKWK